MYKKVIDLLIGMGGVEKERVAINLAKHHPSIFLKMCEEEVKKESLDNNCVAIVNDIMAGRIVEGIKHIHLHWGFDLKASKDIADAFRGRGGFGLVLSERQEDVLQQLIKTHGKLRFAALAQ